MEELTMYVYKDEEGIKEDTIYYARKNDPMLAFLKAQGYKEVKEKPSAKNNSKETEVDF